MSELDLSWFLKDASVADLDWLDVDEEQYRAMDTLPKQNLDIRPDLEALWAREGESPTTYLIPNQVPVPTPGIEDPKTMGDMSQAHGRLRAQAEEIAKVARLALMQSDDTGRLRGELVKRFGLEPLREHRAVLAAVLQERGLLGRLYVAAQDFPTCDRGGSPVQFVRKYASEAKYVLAKKACEGCCHSKPTVAGGSTCGQFQKEIKVQVPYTEHLAEAVETAQAARGREIQAAVSDPKERIRQAFLAPRSTAVRAVYEGQGEGKIPKLAASAPGVARGQLLEASSLVRKKVASEQTDLEARPVMAFLHREMVKGLSHGELAKTLKLAFDESLLKRTHSHWGKLLNESGLYGVVYTKQASFDDCRVGADFLAKHNPSVRAIVAGDKCGSCIYNKAARCMMYGKSLVTSASEVVTSATVAAVLLEHSTAGRLQPWDAKTASTWGDNPVKALKAIHEVTRSSYLPQVAPVRMGFMQGFHGQTVGHTTSGLDRRGIVKQASKYLNEGLYGQDLLAALKSRFATADLVASKDELRSVLAEQGLQGIYYVDPSVYDDYGKGCKEASRLHGTRVVGYLKEGSKCGSCVHQIRTGFCSQINKQLVVEPPYVDKLAQQREILASGSSFEIEPDTIMHNANTLAEFEMQHEMAVEVKEASAPGSVAIQFGTGKVSL
jgi:hypothetical protein